MSKKKKAESVDKERRKQCDVCCEACRYYEPLEEHGINQLSGECVRFPPLKTDVQYGKFPGVEASQWCGEFAPRIRT